MCASHPLTCNQAIIDVVSNRSMTSGETIQAGFGALVYCFKFLRKQILPNINEFFQFVTDRLGE